MAVLVLTCMEDEERAQHKTTAARVAGLADLGVAQVCVVGLPVRRTLLLTALAHGAVVGEDYLKACARARTTLDPAQFELVAEIPAAASPVSLRAVLAGLEVVVRGETSVPRADLVNLLFAAGATVRVARSMLGAAAVEVTRDRQRVEGADEGWLLDRSGEGRGRRHSRRLCCRRSVRARRWCCVAKAGPARAGAENALPAGSNNEAAAVRSAKAKAGTANPGAAGGGCRGACCRGKGATTGAHGGGVLRRGPRGRMGRRGEGCELRRSAATCVTCAR